MAFMLSFRLFMLFLLISIATAKVLPFSKIFNVKSYGAKADGVTDDSKAFSEAWNDACRWKGNGWVFVPIGTYMLHPVLFRGWCPGTTRFVIKGVLRAPKDPNIFLYSDHWITFQYVDRLVVKGGGFLDGQGASAWPYHDCQKNPQCKPLPATMRFDFVTNSRVHHLKSINSKNVHFNIYQCDNMNVSHVRLTCPGNSPNTDGIHIADSNSIKIEHAVIGTGDDCIAMITGTKNVEISDVSCGPGHGISIGSLGKGPKEVVKGIHVRNCSFTDTENGVRIKTWAPSSPGIASDLVFEDIRMRNVRNPIIIDQNYCPSGYCNDQAQSKVEISNVLFKNIWGTSSTEKAVSIKCSAEVPCQNVKLENINIVSSKPRGQAGSLCQNVKGQSVGSLHPPGCL